MSFGGLLPGSAGAGAGAAGGIAGSMGGATAGMTEEQIQQQNMIKTMQAAMESCPVKTVISGGMGFALGGMFGLFMSSMRYDTPLTPAGAAITNLPVREQLRRGFKDMARSSYGSARNFAVVGAIFSGTECCIEGFRARNDLSNGIAAGCITGGVLAAKAGPQAAALGCAGFGAFSAAIDYYMRLPSDEGSTRIV